MITNKLIKNALINNDRQLQEIATAQLKMAPMGRKGRAGNGTQVREGAVLLLLYPTEGETQLLFIKRPDYLKNHPGQVAFPGGRREGDEPLDLTALRETEEEVGVPIGDVSLLGEMGKLYIPPSNFEVTPFVGWVNERPTFQIQEAEVVRTIELPISYLLKPEIQRSEMRLLGELEREIPYFSIPDDKIWGATAMMLNEFLVRINGQLGVGQ